MYSHEEIAEFVRQAASEVAATMLNTTVASEPFRVESTGTRIFKGVMAWVAITGKWKGMGELYCSPASARHLASLLLMGEISDDGEINGEVLDAVSEITNIIIGSLKHSLEGRLGDLRQTVPTIVSGLTFHAKTAMKGPYVVVPMLFGDHHVEIKFCLEPGD